MSLTDDKDVAKAVTCTHCGHEIGANGSPDMIRPVFDAEPEDKAYAILMRAALGRKIHVNCGSCGRGLKVSLRMAGKKTTCPACGKRVKLPLAGQEAERRIEAYIARRSPAAPKKSKDKSRQTEPVGSLMHFDESELAELATFVETDGSDDATLEIMEDDDLMHRSADAIEGREILALNAAISAVAPKRSTSGEKELPALQKAVKERPVQEVSGMSGQTKAIIITAAAALVIGIGLWALISFMNGEATDPGDGGSPIGLNPGDDVPKPPDNTNANANINTNTKPPIVKPIPKKPVKIIAACRAVTSSTDSFAGNGFFPAAPGNVYCRISVQIKAGDDKLELYNFGRSAVLKIGLDSYPSLGEPVKSVLPTLPKKKRLSMEPHESQTMTMLFQLPQKAIGTSGAKGIITLGKMAAASVTLGSSAHVMPAKAVASKPYTEVAPRNTKPLLSDPVMAAIQNTMPQTLSIAPGTTDNSVQLRLGSGQVTGAATRDARGLYVTKLTHNGSTLDCLLRFAHGGRQAILYLSEEPFHQLTFALPGSSSDAPIIPQKSGTIRIRKPSTGVKTPKPKPKPPVTKPKPSTGSGRRPGFFGV
jgi:DNA-directed RNA polymerase subunit RPC12/RpoP